MSSGITLDEAFEIIVISMRDAFLAVTVFVAAMVLLFSWLQYISAGKFVLWIRENRRIQPLIGAIMGLTPGCGGAIIIMPMYTKGYVTYGTVIATLIATLGDAAFVLIGAVFQDSSFLAPVIAVHLISFIVAVIWGFAVDRLAVTPASPLGILWKKADYVSHKIEYNSNLLKEGEIISDMPREVQDGFGYRILHQGYRIWWIVTIVGFLLAVLLLIWYAQDPEYSPNLVWDPSTRDGLITWVGFTGTLLSVILYISSKNFIRDDTEATIGDKLNSLDETLVHAASETAFVTFWVVLAYLIFEFGMIFSGISEADLRERGAGAEAVAIAAMIGLIPGCGPQIIAISAYVEGIVSFPALVSNAISQDGDALFPLLVRHKTASIWATIHTTFPALIVGLVVMWILDEYHFLTEILQP
tara:strand:- start:8307 stop:9548 length:1242 start_codon:yes stop_codon:yes gene_type:complete